MIIFIVRFLLWLSLGRPQLGRQKFQFPSQEFFKFENLANSLFRE